MSEEETKEDALTARHAQSLTNRSAALVRRGLAEALTPQSGTAYYNRGRAKQDDGDFEGAIVDFNKAIRDRPPIC